MKKYEEYKDSGIEWIGEIPKHWEITKYKFMGNLLNGYSFKSDDYTSKGVPILRIGNIQDDINIKNLKKIPYSLAKEFKDYEIQKGDILLALTGATIGKSALYNADKTVLLNQRVGLLRSIGKINQKFLLFLIQSKIFQENIRYLAYGGAQENIGKTEIGNIEITFPNKFEQQNIASFLDRKTTAIDSIIEKKEKLIDKLEAYKKSVITEAVTKGKLGDKYINEDGELVDEIEMKNSGVEWLGEIPKSWEVKKLKYLGRVIGGYAFKSKDFVQEGIKVLKIQNIQHMHINWEDCSYLPDNFYNKYNEYSVDDGDLVFALTRPIISTGIKASIVNTGGDKMLLNQRTGIFKANRNIVKQFLYYLVNSHPFTYSFSLKINATNQPNISTEDIRNIIFCFPSIDEQKIISSFLDKKISELDDIVLKTKKSIKKYKAYKKSLIYEAVTGKIDLRDYDEGGNSNVNPDNS